MHNSYSFLLVAWIATSHLLHFRIDILMKTLYFSYHWKESNAYVAHDFLTLVEIHTMRDTFARTSYIQMCRRLAYRTNTFLIWTLLTGAEARGFLFGVPLALKLNVPFVMARKKNKLPGEKVCFFYLILSDSLHVWGCTDVIHESSTYVFPYVTAEQVHKHSRISYVGICFLWVRVRGRRNGDTQRLRQA